MKNDNIKIPKEAIEAIGTLYLENYFLKKQLQGLQKEVEEIKQELTKKDENVNKRKHN